MLNYLLYLVQEEIITLLTILYIENEDSFRGCVKISHWREDFEGTIEEAYKYANQRKEHFQAKFFEITDEDLNILEANYKVIKNKVYPK